MLGRISDATSTVHGEPQLTASQLPDLAKDNIIEGVRTRKLIPGHEGLEVEGAPEQSLDDWAGGVKLGHDTLLDSLPNLGDADHDGRLELAHITSGVLHGSVGKGSRVAVSEAAANSQYQVLEGHLEDVGQW